MEQTVVDDDAAPKDPGVQKSKCQNYDEEDYEGHRAHTVFVGLHMPPERRHSRSHHHKHHRRSSIDSDSLVNSLNRPVTPPSQRVQFILGEEINDDGLVSHPLFSELEELVHDGDQLEWKETARWIKFEEDVEEGGNRWSKPHVATLSLHSLFELRSFILNGSIMLDMEATTLEQIAELVLENVINTDGLKFEHRDKVKETLLKRHRHLYERRKDQGNKIPIIRSLQDIRRSYSTSKNRLFKVLLCANGLDKDTRNNSPIDVKAPHKSTSNNNFSNKFPETITLVTNDLKGDYHVVPVDESSGKNVISPNATNPNLSTNNSGGCQFLAVPGAGTDAMTKSASNASFNRNLSSHDLSGSSSSECFKGNAHFMKKIPAGAEASNILVGEVDFLEKPIAAFIRLSQPSVMSDLTEVPVPTRFIFILLGPPDEIGRYHEIGRAMATLMSDEIFHEVAYRAKNRNHLLAGIDEFLDAVTVLPPGEWDPTIRIEPPAAIPSQEQRKRPQEKPFKEDSDDEEEEQRIREESGLSRTGRLFGGLVNDLKRKQPWYLSDFKDAVAVQSIASWIFLYFACLSPIITFGGLLSQATGKHMAAMESLVSGFVCGIGYGLFSGQPLTILGSTGPVLVFETIVYDFCMAQGWDYMSVRFWIGTWIAIILLILVATDASAFVCYITRFTEENFACLIAFIFIYKAVENLMSIGRQYPINPNEQNGVISGKICPTPQYVPDVFLMSIILFLGTFLISVHLKDFKNSLFFPSKIRQVLSDFAVIIAIFSMSTLDYYVGIATPKLEVPSEFKPTKPGRGWLIHPFNNNPIYTAFLAVLPALLGTILIFMDQQITAVIVNRKENKLNKGCGYHLDLFVLAILIEICSIVGLPWFVAATVLSINHVNSLKLESECAAPGEKPQFLGVREQRVTHILIFLTIGLSVLLTPMLRNIPMPVLFGVFLYMGVASLKGLQFFDRILIMFMPNKYQPDYMFLRQVPIRRVHMFTLIQLTCLILLWLIKSFSSTSILFPLMLVVMIGIRKSLDLIFTKRELKILDDVMPEMSSKDVHDDLHQLENGEGNKSLLYERSGSLQISLANGNVMKIPVKSINITEEMDKSGVWKQVNDQPVDKTPKKDRTTLKVDRKLRGKAKKQALKKTKLEEKRLSAMSEEDVDSLERYNYTGITIKKETKQLIQKWSDSTTRKSTAEETPV